MNRCNEVTEYINKTSSEHQILLEILRELIHDVIPETTEDFKWGMPVFVKKNIYSYLKSNENHITIGFYNIDKIINNRNMLEGSGKNMRHLKIRSKKDINNKVIADWLKSTVI